MLRWFFLLSLFVLPGTVHADWPVVQPKKIIVTNLARFQGLYLSVFYVNGRPASVGLAGEIQVRKVLRSPVRVQIPAAGQVAITDTVVPKEAGVLTHVVFMVHEGLNASITSPYKLRWNKKAQEFTQTEVVLQAP